MIALLYFPSLHIIRL